MLTIAATSAGTRHARIFGVRTVVSAPPRRAVEQRGLGATAMHIVDQGVHAVPVTTVSIAIATAIPKLLANNRSIGVIPRVIANSAPLPVVVHLDAPPGSCPRL